MVGDKFEIYLLQMVKNALNYHIFNICGKLVPEKVYVGERSKLLSNRAPIPLPCLTDNCR